MKKVKFIWSLCKERDWLEQMAREGWLLTNMSLGIIYDFKQVAPCEKVFEIERFGLSAHPTIQEVNARKFALDVAAQSGWEAVTHDEDLNYYFMKDKAGDETDEFYDDETLRKERAERFRKRYAHDLPLTLMKQDIVLSLFYFLFFLLVLIYKPEVKATIPLALGLLFTIITVFDVLFNHFYMKWGQRIYDELCMSREEWSNYINLSEKKSFSKIHQLLSYLQQKNQAGLALTNYTNGKYLFEKDDQTYEYYIDTKACLKARLKKQGKRFTDEKKDFTLQGLKWYESSIANMAEYSFNPVCITKEGGIIYKRRASDHPLPENNGKSSLSGTSPSMLAIIICLCLLLVGFCIGYFSALFIL